MKELLSSKKNIINILILAILVLAVPLTINLVRREQILFSKAATDSVQLQDNSCTVVQNNKKVLTCPTVDLFFIAPTETELKVTQSLVKKAYADAQCPDDLEYCDTNVNRIYHKTGGVYDPANATPPDAPCIYAYVDTGRACGGTPPSSSAPASSGTATPGCHGGEAGSVTQTQAACLINKRADIKNLYTVQNNWCDELITYPSIINNWLSLGGKSAQDVLDIQSCGLTVRAGTLATPTAPTNSCPVSNSCCYHNPQNALQTCTANGKDTSCPTGFQWCYKGYCVNENYSETSNSCPSPADCPKSGDGTTTTCGTITYDSCVDDQNVPNTSPQFCKNASKFKCAYSKNSACRSQDLQNPSNEFIYSCSACNPTSPSPSAPVTQNIVKVRFAEHESDLTNPNLRHEVAYRIGGVSGSLTFSDPTLGSKFVFAQFVDDKGNAVKASPFPVTIDLVGPTPQVSGFSCEVDITPLNNASDLLFKFVGTNFGQNKGSVTLSDGTSITNFDSWTNNQVIARLSNPPVSQTVTGTQYAATLTTTNGQKSAIQNCAVGITQISLGAKLFCRSQRNFDQDNVNLTLILDKDHSQKSREKVVIDKDGNITNIKTKLKSGENYIACIQAPLSLRKCSAPFTAVAGNNILSINLPVGDYNSDGNINSVDGSLLRSQWGPVTANKNCDVNKDGICNSFEWSCMLHDFNTTNQPEP